MRSTFTELQLIAHDLTQTSVTDTTINTFLKREINNAQREAYGLLRQYIERKQATMTTVSGQSYYFLPIDCKYVSAAKMTINNVDYVMKSIDSENNWNYLNAIIYTASAWPTNYFVRRNDIGFYPQPQGAYTVTLSYNFKLKNLTAEDYVTGTISVTNGSSTVVGVGTAWTSSMVGRWIQIDGYWYEIASVAGGTVLTLYNFYQGLSTSGLTYTIGESPYLPEELGEYLAYYAASKYFSFKKKDVATANYYNNFFYTGDYNNPSRDLLAAVGGILGAKNEYASRSNTGIIRRHPREDLQNSKIWATSISSS